MANQSQSPYRIFLVLDPFRTIAPRLPEVLARLLEVDPYLPGAEGFYDSKTDSALICLKFQRAAVDRIGPDPLAQLVGECGLPIIAPEELGPDEYVAFYSQHLPIYDVHVKEHRDAASEGSLLERLARDLGDRAGRARSLAEGTPPVVLMDDDESLDIVLEMPLRPRNERPSSRWEFDLELEQTDPGSDRPSSQWDLIL